MKINQSETDISNIEDDFIIEASNSKKSKKTSFWIKSAIAVACLGFIYGVHVKLNNSIRSTDSYTVTFDGIRYKTILPKNLGTEHKEISDKYNLPLTITDEMLGEFVGYVGGTHGSKAPTAEVSELYYYKEMPTMDILIMKDYNGDFSYVSSKNLQ